MSDMGDLYRAWKESKKEDKRKHGQPCPNCIVAFPKANPTILLPGQKCFCGHRDARKRSEK